jgi:cytochrome P450
VSTVTSDRQSVHQRVARLFFETDPEIVADPWPLWSELQQMAPVVESGPLFLVTRYAGVKDVHRRQKVFSSDSRRRGSRTIAFRESLTPERRAAWDEIAELHALWMVTTDDPIHTRLRDIVHRAFTPRRIAELEVATRRYVDAAIDDLAGGQTVNLMRLALDVPLFIVTDLLGVPVADRDLIKGFARRWFEFQFVTDDRIFESLEAQRGLEAYVDSMIEEHRRSPNATSLVQAFMGAEHEERLNAREMAANFFLFLFAGHETTSNLIATGMMEVLSRPEQWRRIVADRSLVPGAVEEMLRYVTPAQFHNRFVLEDTTIAGTRIPAGVTVTTLMAAANRDPEVFQDPQTFDVARSDADRHITFGFGRHFCLGSALSRLEANIAIDALARRLPEMTLATDKFAWRGGAQLRGLAELPVHPGPLH